MSEALPLAGVRVVEVASHVFVPMAAAVLAEWGAEVVKVEHPETGDPYRSLTTGGLHNVHRGVDPFFQAANRSKRSVGLDLKHPDGRRLLGRLLAGADVLVTNLRPGAVDRLGLGVEQVREDNPRLVVVRGTAAGVRGPEAGRGGYDAGAYWARSGMQHLLQSPADPYPRPPRPAFGDVVGGLALAGAVCAALLRRATTGEPSVVDGSLLGTGAWQVQTDVVNAALGSASVATVADRYGVWNPLVLPYRTADDRFVALTVVASDPHWPALCAALGRPELAEDPRFRDAQARRENAAACVWALEEVFATRTLAQWRDALAGFPGEWEPVQTPAEVHEDPQVRANGLVVGVDMGGWELPMVPAPVQFDEQPARPRRAPEHGEHTEEVLLELGLTWSEITALKEGGGVL